MVLGSAWLQSLPDQFLEVSRIKGRASLHWTVESVERVPAGRNVEQRDLESMQGIRMVVKKDWEVRQDRVDVQSSFDTKRMELVEMESGGSDGVLQIASSRKGCVLCGMTDDIVRCRFAWTRSVNPFASHLSLSVPKQRPIQIRTRISRRISRRLSRRLSIRQNYITYTLKSSTHFSPWPVRGRIISAGHAIAT